MLGKAKGRYRDAETVSSLGLGAAAAQTDNDAESDEEVEGEGEVSGSSDSQFLQLTSDDGTSEDGTPTCEIKVYLVPMDENGRAGGLRNLGSVTLMMNMPLEKVRSVISSTISVHFEFNHGWRYLQYKRSPEPGQPGAYYVLTMAEEQAITVQTFARPTDRIKPGLFVTQLPEASEKPRSPAADFLRAAAEGSIDEVVRLLDLGVPVTTVDSSGQTALHLAARHNRLGVMLCLTRAKIDPNIADHSGRTPLHCAAESGHRSGVEVLLEAGALLHRSDNNGQRPQDLALHMNHEVIFRLLSEMERTTAANDAEKHPDCETSV